MGTSGHMQHPFDIPNVKTGQDLISYFETIVEHLSTTPGSVKFDGINVSFKLVDDESTTTGKDFRMDRGTSAPESVIGMTAADAYKKWPEGHGMPPAIDELLKIFNEALPQIKPELKALGMWDDPTKYFNTEYMKKGKTNVIEYDEKILALHGVNQFYEKKAQSHRIKKGIGVDRPGLERPIDPETGKPTKHGSTEVSYDPSVLQSIIEKVKPIADLHEVSLVGDVATELSADVDFSATLNEPLTIQMTDTESETHPLRDWLSQAVNPFDAKVQKRDGKTAWAISKEIYFAVLDGAPLMEFLETPEDVKTAINGALFNHATHELGMDVKRASTSSKGGLESHEGIVIRGLDDRPVKVTGDFIVKGAGGAIKDKIKASKEEVIAEVVEEPIDLEYEAEDDFEGLPNKKVIAVYPGRFQPMGQHHAAVFKKILNDPQYDDAYVATSDKVDLNLKDGTPKSPFDFEEKKQIIIAHGIPEDKILKVKNPYHAKELLNNYSPEEVSVVYLVGAKDMKEDPRFQKTEGTTREGYDYKIDVAPHESIDIPGFGEMSGTTLRKALKDADEETYKDIMGFEHPEIYDIIKIKLSGEPEELQEVSQLPLGIFLGLIEQTLNEVDPTAMHGSWAATIPDVAYKFYGTEDDDEERLEEDHIETSGNGVAFKPSKIHGTGAFSTNGHKKDVILGLAFEDLNNDNLYKNYHSPKKINTGGGEAFITLPKKRKIHHMASSVDDGNTWRAQTDLCANINHSTDPNAAIEQRGNNIYVKTMKDILPGEEMTFDYAKETHPIASYLFGTKDIPQEIVDFLVQQDLQGEGELEEISGIGVGPGVEGYPGPGKRGGEKDEKQQGLIREVEDYLYKILGAQ